MDPQSGNITHNDRGVKITTNVQLNTVNYIDPRSSRPRLARFYTHSATNGAEKSVFSMPLTFEEELKIT